MLVNAILPERGITSVKLNPTENVGLREDSRENAKKMKDLGLEADIICKATGLTEKEVAAL